MILRGVRDHVAHHNWFAVAIDLSIVIVGVFVGTQASNWNQGRLDRERGRESRAMLIEDLHANRQNLDLRRRYYEWVRGEALQTLAALDRPSTALGQQFLIDSYQSSQILPWSLKRNTYDQLIAGGDLGNVGDAALRDQITNYYATTDSTAPNLAATTAYREILRRAMPYAAQLQIRTSCAEKISENSKGEAEMALPRACAIRLDPAILRQAIGQVHDTPGLALDLNRLLVDLDQKLISVDLISRRGAKLERALTQAS
jgi:hypothetical protein